MKKGAIFDLDGTLLDSMGVWRQIDQEFLAKRGLAVPMDYMEAISAMSFQKAAEYTISRFGFSEKPEELIGEWMDMAKEAYAHQVKLKEGAVFYLESLKKLGVKIAAATSCDPALFLPCLRNNGVLDLFDTVVTVEEVKRGKGFPDIYELAAERLGLNNEDCVVFEDIYQGVAGAKMGGFSTVGILDESSSFEWEKIRAEADKTVENYVEMEGILPDFT